MLTVLWRKPDGAEMLFSAERIERTQPEGEQCCPAIGKWFKVWTEPGDLPGPFEINIEAPFGAVFVMNKYGATVARYMASPPIAVVQEAA
jgi:hypothetical protein